MHKSKLFSRPGAAAILLVAAIATAQVPPRVETPAAVLETPTPPPAREVDAPAPVPSPAPTLVPTPSPEVVHASEETPKPHADLREIRAARTLRVLVRRVDTGTLPREGSASSQNAILLDLLAGRLGVSLRFVVVPEGQRLVDALLQGRGDLIGARHVDSPAGAGTAYSAPLRTVEEVIVCRAAASDCPKSAGQLATRKVVLPLRDAVAGTRLARWNERVKRAPAKEGPRNADSLDLIQRVGSGEIDLTVAYSDELATYLTYGDDVRAAFALRDKIPVSWTVRADATALLEAANGLIFSSGLSAHLGENYAGDLAEIKARKVLRVAMLNNGASYFLYRGYELGFQYELAQALARRLEVRLAVVVPERPADMPRLLREGRVDLIPFSPDEEGRGPEELLLSRPILFADQVLVQRTGETPVKSVAQLSGREVHVRWSASYRPALEKLAREIPDFRIVAAKEESDTEQLIDQVGKRKIPATVSNSLLLDVERTYRSDVRGTLVISPHQPLVYGVRNASPALLAFVNEALAAGRAERTFQALVDKYFKRSRRFAERKTAASPEAGHISPFDELVRKYARQYGLDWRLVAAQMFHESRFDPEARSWVGALGLLQLMPRTAAEMGFTDVAKPESNIHAGVRYMSQMLDRFEPSLPVQQRVRFALASYNAGLDHVLDARELARQNGWDPDRWFGNVEKAMLLLETKTYYRKARRGYCRGSEPVAYVSRIQSSYDAYARLFPAGGDSRARDDKKKDDKKKTEKPPRK